MQQVIDATVPIRRVKKNAHPERLTREVINSLKLKDRLRRECKEICNADFFTDFLKSLKKNQTVCKASA